MSRNTLSHGAERLVRSEIGSVESIRDSERTGKTFDHDSFVSSLEKALLACCGLKSRLPLVNSRDGISVVSPEMIR